MSNMFPSNSYDLHIVTFIFLLMAKGSMGTTFTLVNRCHYTVWPGILSNAGSPGLDTTGFELNSGSSRSFQAQPGWSGRFWGRTGCSFDPATGQGNCATGDCRTNQLACNGATATPPATLAEFTVGGSGGQDFYDVSLVDGYNLPMIIEPSGGSGACGLTGCVNDLNRRCPSELRSGDGQGCKSACEAFGNPEYCCSGAYATPDTCRPSQYSAMFKSACPRSYSYAYDDPTSTFTCSGADYTITFCPSRTSQKSLSDPSTPASAGTQQSASPDSSGSPPEDNLLPEWISNFVSGGSTNFVLPYSNVIFCAATTIFLAMSQSYFLAISLN